MIFFSSLVNFLRQQHTARATGRLLHSMDDHLLQDIGIRRDQIESLISEQRVLNRKKAAAEAKNRRSTSGSNSSLGGHGLAAQH